MARVIVELLNSDHQQVEKRYVFDQGTANIGRSYSNDIILDDPFVSPEHVFVSRNGNGIFVRDLASDNGTQVNGSGNISNKTIKLKSGEDFLVGKTRLKVYLPEHPVEPVKPLGRLGAIRQLMDRPWVANLSTLIVAGVAVALGYMDQPSEKFWQKEFPSILALSLSVIVITAGLLCLYTRLKYKKFFYMRNTVISSASMLFALLIMVIQPFLYFGILDERWENSIGLTLDFFLTFILLYACVRLTHDFISRKDIVPLAWLTVFITLISALGTDVIHLGFESTPTYNAHLAPYMEPLSEPASLDQFLESNSRELFAQNKDL